MVWPPLVVAERTLRNAIRRVAGTIDQHRLHPVVFIGTWEEDGADALPAIRSPPWTTGPPFVVRRIDTTLTSAITTRDFTVPSGTVWLLLHADVDASAFAAPRIVGMQLVGPPAPGAAPARLLEYMSQSVASGDRQMWPTNVSSRSANQLVIRESAMLFSSAAHLLRFGGSGLAAGESFTVRALVAEFTERTLISTGVSDLTPD